METLRVHPEKLILILALLGLIATESLVLVRLNTLDQRVSLPGFGTAYRASQSRKFESILPIKPTDCPIPFWIPRFGPSEPDPVWWKQFCEWLQTHGLSCDKENVERDYDKDGWSNYEEWKAGTTPIDASVYPTPDRFLVLEKVIREEFPLRFRGYTRSADGQVTFAINVRNMEYTYFVPFGRQIASERRREMYGVEKFEQVLEERHNASLNAPESVDRSRVTLRNLVDGSEVILTYGETAYAPELKAVLRDLLNETSIPVKAGDTIPIRNQKYRIDEIKPDGIQLLDDLNRTFPIRRSLGSK